MTIIEMTPPSGRTAKGRRRFGIGPRLFLAFGATAFMTVVASGIAWLIFGGIGNALLEVTGSGVPAITSALRLSQETAELAAAAPELSLAESEDARKQGAANLTKRLDNLGTLVAAIAAGEKNNAEVKKIQEDRQLIASAIEALDNSVKRRLELSARRAALGKSVTDLHQKFIATVIPLVDDANTALRVSGGTVSVGEGRAFQDLMNGSVGALRVILEIRATGHQLSGLLSEALQTKTVDQLNALAHRFDDAASTARADIVNLPDAVLANKLTTLLGSLTALGTGETGIFHLKQQALNPGKLKPEDLQATLKSLEQAPKAIAAMDQDFQSSLQPMVDDVNRDLRAKAGQTAKSSQAAINELMNGGVASIRRVLEIHADGNLIAGLLIAALNATDTAALEPMEERFKAAAAHLKQNVDGLGQATEAAAQTTKDATGVAPGGSSTGLDAEKVKALQSEVRQLIAYGEGDNGVFRLRQFELDSISTAQIALRANRALSAQLAQEVDKLTAAKQAEIGTLAARADAAIKNGRQLLIAIALGSLVIAMLIAWLYAGRNLTRRLKRLAAGMNVLASGNLDVDVPTGGSDEIAAMAAAMQVFKENAIERRRLREEQAASAARPSARRRKPSARPRRAQPRRSAPQ